MPLAKGELAAKLSGLNPMLESGSSYVKGPFLSSQMPVADFFSQQPEGGAVHTVQGQDFLQDMPSPREALRSEQPAEPGYAPQTSKTPRNQPQVPKTMLESMNQKMFEIQKTMSTLIGDPKAFEEMAQVLGPNACFEDILAYVMMKIAREEERKVLERVETLENGGHPGLKGWLANRAADLGGLAGGVLGGIGGGAAGAAVGQDIGKRLVNSATGYNSEDSRQIQFEKLKQQMNKLNELMSCMSNILKNMHDTTKNTISNIRA